MSRTYLITDGGGYWRVTRVLRAPSGQAVHAAVVGDYGSEREAREVVERSLAAA
jgi:hypothetical protein